MFILKSYCTSGHIGAVPLTTLSWLELYGSDGSVFRSRATTVTRIHIIRRVRVGLNVIAVLLRVNHASRKVSVFSGWLARKAKQTTEKTADRIRERYFPVHLGRLRSAVGFRSGR